MKRKINALKRTIPISVLSETERAIIGENFDYCLRPVICCGKVVNCLEFQDDILEVLDDIDCCKLNEDYLSEAELTAAEKRGFATRVSTVAFQMIRELGYINGANLIEIGKSLKVVGRCIALACVIGLGNIDISMARRLLPLVRAI